MKNRLLTLILALLMTSSAFTMFSCGESDVNSETTPNTADTTGEVAGNNTLESTENGEPVNERLLIDDELPNTRFDGKTFRILTNGSFAGYDYIDEIIAEDLTGDACNDAIYNRNGVVEDRFGITIEGQTVSEPHTEVKNIATAGTTDYQVVGFQGYLINGPITAGALYNWCEMPYTDLDKPWHNKLANDDSTINGILYGICSDISTSSMTFTHTIFLNTQLFDDFGNSLDDLYSTIKEGKWTFDYFSQLVSTMYKDYDGSGVADKADIYGFGYNITNPADVWFTAFGGKTYNLSEDGVLELTFMNEQTVSMYEKLYDFHYQNPGYYLDLDTQYMEETYFRDEKFVMAPMRFLAAFNTLREMESTYTMIPFPKWTEEQAAYYTNADDKFSLFGIPLSVAGDAEFISIIFEALCAESYKTVYPAYYDTALKGKYSSDATTAEMVDLIMEGRAFDFSFQFSDTFVRLPYMFRDNIKDGNRNLSSKYRTVEKAAKKNVEKVIGKAYGLY